MRAKSLTSIGLSLKRNPPFVEMMTFFTPPGDRLSEDLSARPVE